MEEGRISPQESLSGQPVRLDLGLAPDLGEIGRLIESFEGLSDRLQLAPAIAFGVALVLDELLTNRGDGTG